MAQEFSTIIEHFPRQLVAGLRAAKEALSETSVKRIRHPLSHLVFCGMGGSALPALLLRDIIRSDTALARKHRHIIVHRDYGLPPEATNSNALVIITSYSGNTEEALSSYQRARRHHLPVLTIASGGALKTRALRDKIPFARITPGLSPRFTVGEQFSATAEFLTELHFFPKSLRTHIQETARVLKPRTLLPEARRIAHRLRNRIPLIYASSRNEALAYMWKIQMNENAKIPAFTNVLPELNHNELNSYAILTAAQSKLRKALGVVMLNDTRDATTITKRMRITAAVITKSGVPVIPVSLLGAKPLTRSFNAFLLGEWTAGVLATTIRVNPLPTTLIEEFKHQRND